MDLQQLHPLWTLYLGFLGILVFNSRNAGSQGIENNMDLGMYKPTFKPTSKNITVGQGDMAILRCRVQNLGTRTVTWRRSSEPHPMTIGLFTFVGDTRVSVDYNQRTSEWNLKIQDVKPSDEGTYQCQISTKQEQKRSYDIQLNVKTVRVSGSNVVHKGSPVQLVCNATGKPEPPHDVEWFKNGMKVQSNAESGVLITKKINAHVLISVLVIKNSKMRDSGDYICRSSTSDVGMKKVHILNVLASNVKRSDGSTKQLKSPSAAPAVHACSWLPTALLCSVVTLLMNLSHRYPPLHL